MPTITRKIQINFNVQEKSDLKALYDKWYKWQRIVHKAANFIVSHQYVQDQIKDFFYLTDGIKMKLADSAKNDDGMLMTSRDNTTYQLLSKHFKGECPMGMLSGLNTVITKTYKKESKDIWIGKRSVRSYRGNIPMPMRFADSSNWTKHEDGNYSFSVYGTSFNTWFGKDLSDNESIVDRAMAGEYKFCDSSIQMEKGKIFLLAVFSFEKQSLKLDKEKVADCFLSVSHPIVIKEKKDKIFSIGSADEYLHGRLAIKGALRRVQKACKYNKGGKGRKKKMMAIDRFERAEKDYVNTKMHVYSRELIRYCLKRGIGKIILNNYSESVEDTHQETEVSKFLLASWSYFNLSDKIKYKASVCGIEVEVL